MNKREDWRDLMAHDWPDDFDKEKAWDFIGMLLAIVAVESAVIIILIVMIFYWIL